MKLIKKELISVADVPIRELTLDEFKSFVIMQTDNARPLAEILISLVKTTTGLTKEQIDNQLTIADYIQLLQRIVQVNEKWFKSSRSAFSSVPVG